VTDFNCNLLPRTVVIVGLRLSHIKPCFLREQKREPPFLLRFGGPSFFELTTALVCLCDCLAFDDVILVDRRVSYHDDSAESASGFDEGSSRLVVQHLGCTCLELLPLRHGDGIGDQFWLGLRRAAFREELEVLHRSRGFIGCEVEVGDFTNELCELVVEALMRFHGR